MTPSVGLEIELSDFKAENATLKGEYLQQVVAIVIGGVPTILEVRFMCLFMSPDRILLQGSVSTNQFDPMTHQVGHRKVEVGIQLLGNNYLAADTIPPGDHVVSRLGGRPSFSIGFLVYLLFLHGFGSQGMGFGLGLFACSPEYNNILEGVIMMQGVLHVAQWCIIVRFISIIHIEF